MTYPIRLKKVGALGGSVLLAALALAGCGGGSSSDEPVAAPEASDSVPASAGASVQALVDFQTSLAASDTTEPLKMQGFLAPNDDTAEPFAVR